MTIHTGHSRLGRIGAGFLACALLLTACDIDKLLEVEDPDTVNPGTLDDPALLAVLVAGAKGDFTGAYSGSGGDAFVSTTALMSDELFSSGTFTTRTATDRRLQQSPTNGNTSDGAYNNLEGARRALRDAAIKVEEFEGQSDPRYGELKALEGYTYVALGEGFCGAIPFSEVAADGSFEFGTPQTTTQVFQASITRFDDALSAGAAFVANIGKARALLDLGQYDQAAAAVSGVPTTYNYFIFHSVSGASNPIYSLQGNGRYSLSDREGGTGMPFRSADDPRVPWIRDPGQPNGFDANIPLYKVLKYNAFTTPVVLASGVEARLIEAEAALRAGNTAEWLSKLNALRADVGPLMRAQLPDYTVQNPTLAPLEDPGTPAARRDLLFRERAFWLYGTGHRLGDMRRLVTQYGLSESQVYPTGEYHKGGDYGTDVAFPIDVDEENNPNFDSSQCNVQSAG